MTVAEALGLEPELRRHDVRGRIAARLQALPQRPHRHSSTTWRQAETPKAQITPYAVARLGSQFRTYIFSVLI
jgi:hypothetical protein